MQLTKLPYIDYDVSREMTYDRDKGSIYYPLVYRDGVYYEGYWRGRFDKSGPYPRDTEIKLNSKFIRRVEILTRKIDGTLYLNLLSCRLCDRDLGGENECIVKGKDEIYIFPNTILHFYELHNVLPSEEFYIFVMRIHPDFFQNSK